MLICVYFVIAYMTRVEETMYALGFCGCLILLKFVFKFQHIDILAIGTLLSSF